MQSRKIVVVGGSRGIGLAIVKRLVNAGADVTVVSRSALTLASLPIAGHVCFDATTGELSKSDLPDVIDGFVYSPGSINLGPLRSLRLDAMQADFELNVLGAVRCLQGALSGLMKSDSASTVFFSTVAVSQGLPMHSSIAAAKGAIEALVRTWASELSPTIRVNAIAPALTDTPLAEKLLSTDEKRQAMAERYPLKRVGVVDDMASAACYLLSSESGWITGQVLHIDGGMSTVRK